MSRKRTPGQTRKQTEALDRGVRKVEQKEKRQDQRKGTTGKPARSTGRAVRQGWKESA